MLGEGGAAFQDASTDQIGDQGPAGADRIDAGMPPEAAVLTGEQGIDQQLGVTLQPPLFPVAAVIGGGDRPIGTVVEEQWPAHAGEAAADGQGR